MTLKKIGAVLAATAVLVACAGCGKDSKASDEPKGPTPTYDEGTTPEDFEEEEEFTLETSTTPIPVNGELEDPIFMQHIKILNYYPSYPIDPAIAAEQPSWEGAQLIVAEVEFSVSEDVPYSVSLWSTDLKLVLGEKVIPNNITYELAEATGGALTPIAEQTKRGETNTGYVAWMTTSPSEITGYSLKIERKKTEIIGSDEVIEAAEFILELPQP
ncbi:MAG: hypothetical protein LBH68_01745 [Bifidobacteriaceae bacterium]|jgi:hypothetical protein|nr:hypothetical protein [Bifidobacteriaceae bacterium]